YVAASDIPATTSRSSVWRLLIFYGLLTAGCIGCFFAIRSVGEGLPRRENSSAAEAQNLSAALSAAHALPQLLLALAAVILTGRLLATALARVGQPPVIGEVLAGILLGPSLFSWFGYEASPLLPGDVA